MTVTDIITMIYSVTAPLQPYVLVTFGLAMVFAVSRDVIDMVLSGFRD